MSQSRNNSRMIRSPRARLRGVNLIELMVAMVISLVLIGGAIQVYLFSRENYDANESVSRLQETARYALSLIEPDIRMANSWGLVKGSGFVDVSGVTATDTNCGDKFAVDVMNTLGGSNDGYTMACAAFGAGAMATADTLVVRRASVLPATTGSPVKVCSTRTQATLVTGATPTCPASPIGQLNDLIVNAYYIDRDSDRLAGLPTLRRYGLDTATTLKDVEIVPGIEDMQVQFGIDPSGIKGIATRYVNPGDVPAAAQVVSVRIWLLVRSETPDQGFNSDKVYQYGERSDDNGTTSDLTDMSATTAAFKPNDKFRRLLVSRTIQVRNAMGI